jgi:hypothetical protein
MLGGSCAYEGTDPVQGIGGKPVTPRMVEPLNGCDQLDAALQLAA